jgi:hypothetical protein
MTFLHRKCYGLHYPVISQSTIARLWTEPREYGIRSLENACEYFLTILRRSIPYLSVRIHDCLPPQVLMATFTYTTRRSVQLCLCSEERCLYRKTSVKRTQVDMDYRLGSACHIRA